MKQRTKELLAGIFTICLFLFLAWAINQRSHIKKQNMDFVLYADLQKADGLLIGADVRIAGMKVGKLIDFSITNGYAARLKLALEKDFNLPLDSSIAIETDGLLGGKYLEIVPGAEEEFLKSGEHIIYTQNALLLDELLEKLNVYMRQKNEEKESL